MEKGRRPTTKDIGIKIGCSSESIATSVNQEVGLAVNKLIVAKNNPDGTGKLQEAMTALLDVLANKPGALEELISVQNGK